MFPLPHFTNRTSVAVFDVWVSRPALAGELAVFLRNTAYEPIDIRGETISVLLPPGLDERLARLELDLYLRLWRRRHPSETAEIV